MKSDINNNGVSSQANVLVKIAYIVTFIVIMSSESYIVKGGGALITATFLMNSKILQVWSKLIAKLSPLLIGYIVIAMLSGNDLEYMLNVVGKNLCYAVYLVWLRETTTIDDYLSDMERFGQFFGNSYLGYKLKRGIYYLSYYIVNTLEIFNHFLENFHQLKQDGNKGLALFINIFVTTFINLKNIRYETDQKMNFIQYRDFNINANMFIVTLIAMVIGLQWLPDFIKILGY